MKPDHSRPQLTRQRLMKPCQTKQHYITLNRITSNLTKLHQTKPNTFVNMKLQPNIKVNFVTNNKTKLKGYVMLSVRLKYLLI